MRYFKRFALFCCPCAEQNSEPAQKPIRPTVIDTPKTRSQSSGSNKKLDSDHSSVHSSESSQTSATPTVIHTPRSLVELSEQVKKVDKVFNMLGEHIQRAENESKKDNDEEINFVNLPGITIHQLQKFLTLKTASESSAFLLAERYLRRLVQKLLDKEKPSEKIERIIDFYVRRIIRRFLNDPLVDYAEQHDKTNILNDLGQHQLNDAVKKYAQVRKIPLEDALLALDEIQGLLKTAKSEDVPLDTLLSHLPTQSVSAEPEELLETVLELKQSDHLEQASMSLPGTPIHSPINFDGLGPIGIPRLGKMAHSGSETKLDHMDHEDSEGSQNKHLGHESISVLRGLDYSVNDRRPTVMEHEAPEYPQPPPSPSHSQSRSHITAAHKELIVSLNLPSTVQTVLVEHFFDPSYRFSLDDFTQSPNPQIANTGYDKNSVIAAVIGLLINDYPALNDILHEAYQYDLFIAKLKALAPSKYVTSMRPELEGLLQGYHLTTKQFYELEEQSRQPGKKSECRLQMQTSYDQTFKDFHKQCITLCNKYINKLMHDLTNSHIALVKIQYLTMKKFSVTLKDKKTNSGITGNEVSLETIKMDTAAIAGFFQFLQNYRPSKTINHFLIIINANLKIINAAIEVVQDYKLLKNNPAFINKVKGNLAILLKENLESIATFSQMIKGAGNNTSALDKIIKINRINLEIVKATLSSIATCVRMIKDSLDPTLITNIQQNLAAIQANIALIISDKSNQNTGDATPTISKDIKEPIEMIRTLIERIQMHLPEHTSAESTSNLMLQI